MLGKALEPRLKSTGHGSLQVAMLYRRGHAYQTPKQMKGKLYLSLFPAGSIMRDHLSYVVAGETDRRTNPPWSMVFL
jgi:hypothetical protein